MAIGDLAGHAGQVLPRLIVAVAVTVTLLLRPQLFYNFETSPLAWIVAAGIVVISAVVRRLVARRSVPAAPWAAAVVTLTLFAVVAAPSFRTRTLVEDFPVVAAPMADMVPVLASPTALPSESPSPVPSPAAASSAPVAATVSPAPRASATVAAPVQTAPVVRPPTASPKPKPTTAATATLLSAGQLEGLAGHDASGRTALYRVGDGTVLRFENVDINGAAKPSVHLVPPGKHRPEGGVALGPLKAERGSFSYAVPASVDANAMWTVLIWCAPYDVPIGAADLR